MITTPTGNGKPRQLTDAILDRVPPSNVDAERCLLGSVFMDPRRLAEVVSIVAPDDFHDTNYREVARVLWAMRVAGEEPDAIIVAARLTGLVDVENVAYFVGSLAASVGVGAHAAKYAMIVARKARQRDVIHAATDAIARANEDVDPETIGADLQAELFERIRPIGQPKVSYSKYTAAELDAAQFSLEYLVERSFVAGQPCLIAGAKKCLKTSVALDLAVSLATQTPFLDSLTVYRPATVGVMSAESGLATIQETLRRQCHAKGLRLADVDRLIVSSDVPRLGDVEHGQAVQRFIEDNALEVLIVDPAYLALVAADPGNIFAQGELLRGISETCQAANCCLVLVHHTRKNIATAFEPPQLEDVSWAGFQEWTRQWLLLGRREQYEPGTGLHRLWLVSGGSAGHSACWALDIDEGQYDGTGGRFWRPTLSTATQARGEAEEQREAARDAKRQEQIAADAKEIISAAVKAGGPETKNGLRDRVAIPHRRFPAAFAYLVADGTLQPAPITRPNGHTYEGWKLKDDENA